MLNKKTPLVFGEALFDVFNENEYVLGGAPFNVAWHLHGFGLNPFLISRIGNDKNGENIIRKMNNWGMYLQNVQRDKSHPTGIVKVYFKENEPKFDIIKNQAYDYIEYGPIKTHLLIKSYPILYHGTLALRNETSRQTLKRIKENTDTKIFLDVNLRDPWWDKKILIQSLQDATWTKCNADEFQLIVKISETKGDNFKERAHLICKKYGLEFLIITQGEKGAILTDKKNKSFQISPQSVSDIKDTVGAGDGFSAVSIIGILNNWDKKILLQRANNFASRLCEIKGATLDDKNLYQNFKSNWENKNG